MANSIRATKQGLEIIDLARIKKGWSKEEEAWYQLALVGRSTLKRFWQRSRIRPENFVKICEVVGVNDWQKIADLSLPSNKSLLEIEIKAVVEEVDKPFIDNLISQLLENYLKIEVKANKIPPGSETLAQDWQPVETVLPKSKTRFISSENELPEASIRRAKKIELGETNSVVLIVQMILEFENQVGVIVEVYPAEDTTHLPESLQIVAIDELSAIISEATAERGDDSMQLEFGIEPEELFSVQLTLDNVTIREDF
ncbi:MAG: DUF1822 family protein [Kamptonema sp. SIO1D9]|nr:DUF1822 family protein [Kamptonema sp. SIO1D9]